MTPKEKAEELFEKFNKEGLPQISSLVNRFIRKEMIKQCALIAVHEIIKSNELDYFMTKDQIDSLEVTSDDLWLNEEFTKYWKKVKQEILAL
jgi:hypothetical protein